MEEKKTPKEEKEVTSHKEGKIETTLNEGGEDETLNEGGEDETLNEGGEDETLNEGGEDETLNEGGEDETLNEGGEDETLNEGGEDETLNEGGEDETLNEGGEDKTLNEGGEDKTLNEGGEDETLNEGGEDKTLNEGGEDKTLNEGGEDETLNEGGEDETLNEGGEDETLNEGGEDKTLNEGGEDKTLNEGGEDKTLNEGGEDETLNEGGEDETLNEGGEDETLNEGGEDETLNEGGEDETLNEGGEDETLNEGGEDETLNEGGEDETLNEGGEDETLNEGGEDETLNEGGEDETLNEGGEDETLNEGGEDETLNEGGEDETLNEGGEDETLNEGGEDEKKVITKSYKKRFYLLLIFIICLLISQTISENPFINPNSLIKPKLRFYTIEDVLNSNDVPIENSDLITYWRNVYNFSKKNRWDSVQYFLQKANELIKSENKEIQEQKPLYSIHNELIGKILSDSLLVDSVFNFLQNGEVLAKKDTSITISDSSVIDTSKTIEENPPIKNIPTEDSTLPPYWQAYSDSMTNVFLDIIDESRNIFLPQKGDVKVYVDDEQNFIVNILYGNKQITDTYYYTNESAYKVIPILIDIVENTQNSLMVELHKIEITTFANKNYREKHWVYNGNMGPITYRDYFLDGEKSQIVIPMNTPINDIENKFLISLYMSNLLKTKWNNVSFKLNVNIIKSKKYNNINVMFQLKKKV